MSELVTFRYDPATDLFTVKFGARVYAATRDYDLALVAYDDALSAQARASMRIQHFYH